MKLLATSALLASSAFAVGPPAENTGTSDSDTQASAPKLQGTCNDDGKLLFTIPYGIADSKVLKLKAGRCDETAADDLVKFSQPNADQAHLELDIAGCGLADNRYENQIANRFLGAGAGFFTGQAVVEFGRESDAGEQYRFYNASLRTECGVATDYTATFSYGKIHHLSSVDDVVAGDYTEIQFNIEASLDNFANKYNATAGARAGDTMFFAVAPTGGFKFAKYDFAVSSCQVQSGDDQVVLFDHAKNTCDNDFIDFTYQPIKSSAGYGFNMTHRLFVVGHGQFAEQNLTCNIKLCDRNDANSLCTKVYKNCDLNQCSCNFGEAATGADCDVNHSSKCMNCEFGYYLDTASCYENQCRCADGNPTVHTACPKNGDNFCKECNAGFHLEQNQCVKNECLCDNGIGTNGVDCEKHGEQKCASCKNGYSDHNKDDSCLENQCKCKNGQGRSGEKCAQHDAYLCKSCDDGFKLHIIYQDTCEPNQCSCKNGMAATGVNCPKDGDAKCDKCDPYYTKDSADQCITNTCKCDEGIAATGRNCPNNGEVKCVQCDAYHTKNDVEDCIVNTCTCKNGQAGIFSTCPDNGKEKCLKCDDGFHLNDVDTCEANVCTCKGGFANTGSDCKTHETESCKSCKAGYRPSKSGDQCDANICTCKNGKANTGSNCDTHNTESCESCDTGYEADQSTCKKSAPKVCTCKHGIAATGVDCEDWNGTELCDSCTGFHDDTGKFRTSELFRSRCDMISSPAKETGIKCKCGAGAATQNDICVSADQEHCWTCQFGYVMNSNFECVKVQDSGSAPP